MRILTGKDRVEHEGRLQRLSMLEAENRALHHTCDAHEKYENRLIEMCDRERQRADTAVDELLAIRGIPPISPQPPLAPSGDFNPLAEDPAEAERIEKRMMEMGPAAVLAETKR